MSGVGNSGAGTGTGSGANNNRPMHQQHAAGCPAAPPEVDLSHLTEEERLMIQSVMVKAEMAEMGVPVDTSGPSSTNLPSNISIALTQQRDNMTRQQQLKQQQQQQQNLVPSSNSSNMIKSADHQASVISGQYNNNNNNSTGLINQTIRQSDPNRVNHETQQYNQQNIDSIQTNQNRMPYADQNINNNNNIPNMNNNLNNNNLSDSANQFTTNLGQQHQQNSNFSTLPSIPNLGSNQSMISQDNNNNNQYQQQQHHNFQQPQQQQNPMIVHQVQIDHMISSISHPNNQQFNQAGNNISNFNPTQQNQQTVNPPMMQQQQNPSLGQNINPIMMSESNIVQRPTPAAPIRVDAPINPNMSHITQNDFNQTLSATRTLDNQQQLIGNNNLATGMNPISAATIMQPPGGVNIPNNLIEQQQQQQQYNAIMNNPNNSAWQDQQSAYNMMQQQQQQQPTMVYNQAMMQTTTPTIDNINPQPMFSGFTQIEAHRPVRRTKNRLSNFDNDQQGSLSDYEARGANQVKRSSGSNRKTEVVGGRRRPASQNELARGRELQAYDLASQSNSREFLNRSASPNPKRHLPPKPVSSPQAQSVRFMQQQLQPEYPFPVVQNRAPTAPRPRSRGSSGAGGANESNSNFNNLRNNQNNNNHVRHLPKLHKRTTSLREQSSSSFSGDNDEEDDDDDGNVNGNYREFHDEKVGRRLATGSGRHNHQNADERSVAGAGGSQLLSNNNYPEISTKSSKSVDGTTKLLNDLRLAEQANQVMEQQQKLIKQSQELIRLQLEQQALSQELKKSIKKHQKQEAINNDDDDDNRKSKKTESEAIGSKEISDDEDELANDIRESKGLRRTPRDKTNNTGSDNDQKITTTTQHSNVRQDKKNDFSKESQSKRINVDEGEEEDDLEDADDADDDKLIFSTCSKVAQDDKTTIGRGTKIRSNSTATKANNITKIGSRKTSTKQQQHHYQKHDSEPTTDTTNTDSELEPSSQSSQSKIGAYNRGISGALNNNKRDTNRASSSGSCRQTIPSQASSSSTTNQSTGNTNNNSNNKARQRSKSSASSNGIADKDSQGTPAATTSAANGPRRRREPKGLPASPLPVAAAIQLHQIQQQQQQQHQLQSGQRMQSRQLQLAYPGAGTGSQLSSAANLRSRSVTSSPLHDYYLTSGYATDSNNNYLLGSSSYINNNVNRINNSRASSPTDTQSEFGFGGRGGAAGLTSASFRNGGRKRLPKTPTNAVPVTPSMMRKITLAKQLGGSLPKLLAQLPAGGSGALQHVGPSPSTATATSPWGQQHHRQLSSDHLFKQQQQQQQYGQIAADFNSLSDKFNPTASLGYRYSTGGSGSGSGSGLGAGGYATLANQLKTSSSHLFFDDDKSITPHLDSLLMKQKMMKQIGGSGDGGGGGKNDDAFDDLLKQTTGSISGSGILDEPSKELDKIIDDSQIFYSSWLAEAPSNSNPLKLSASLAGGSDSIERRALISSLRSGDSSGGALQQPTTTTTTTATAAAVTSSANNKYNNNNNNTNDNDIDTSGIVANKNNQHHNQASLYNSMMYDPLLQTKMFNRDQQQHHHERELRNTNNNNNDNNTNRHHNQQHHLSELELEHHHHHHLAGLSGGNERAAPNHLNKYLYSTTTPSYNPSAATGAGSAGASSALMLDGAYDYVDREPLELRRRQLSIGSGVGGGGSGASFSNVGDNATGTQFGSGFGLDSQPGFRSLGPGFRSSGLTGFSELPAASSATTTTTTTTMNFSTTSSRASTLIQPTMHQGLASSSLSAGKSPLTTMTTSMAAKATTGNNNNNNQAGYYNSSPSHQRDQRSMLVARDFDDDDDQLLVHGGAGVPSSSLIAAGTSNGHLISNLTPAEMASNQHSALLFDQQSVNNNNRLSHIGHPLHQHQNQASSSNNTLIYSNNHPQNLTSAALAGTSGGGGGDPSLSYQQPRSQTTTNSQRVGDDSLYRYSSSNAISPVARHPGLASSSSSSAHNNNLLQDPFGQTGRGDGAARFGLHNHNGSSYSDDLMTSQRQTHFPSATSMMGHYEPDDGSRYAAELTRYDATLPSQMPLAYNNGSQNAPHPYNPTENRYHNFHDPFHEDSGLKHRSQQASSSNSYGSNLKQNLNSYNDDMIPNYDALGSEPPHLGSSRLYNQEDSLTGHRTTTSYGNEYHHLENRLESNDLGDVMNMGTMTQSTSRFAPLTKDDIISGAPKFSSIGYRFRTSNQNKYVPQARASNDSSSTRYPFPYKRILLSKNPKDRIVTSGAFVDEVFQSSNVHFIGDMNKGDQIIEWNGVNLCNRSNEEVQQILLSQFSDDEVEIIYLPQEKAIDVYGDNWSGTASMARFSNDAKIDDFNQNNQNRNRRYSFERDSTMFNDENYDSTIPVRFSNKNNDGAIRRKLSLSSLTNMWNK